MSRLPESFIEDFSIKPTGALEGVVHVPEAEHFFHGRLPQLKDIVRHHFIGRAV